MDKFKRSILIVLFAVSLVMSHYAISYLYIYGFILAFLTLQIKKVHVIDDLFYKIIRKDKLNFNSSPEEGRLINLTFILLFIIVVLSWYIFTSSSSIFITVIDIVRSIAHDLIPRFLNPEFSQSSTLLLQQHSTILGQISKYLYLITQFFIVVGLILVITKRTSFKFKREYIALSIGGLVLLVASVVIPYLAGTLNASRMYHIELIVLAPFCIVGGVMVLNAFFNLFKGKISWTKNSFNNSLRILSIFLAVFLLFNTHFVNELTEIDPKSIALSKNSIEIERFGDLNSAKDYYISSGYINQKDIYGMYWLSENRYEYPVYADTFYNQNMFISYGGYYPAYADGNFKNLLPPNSAEVLVYNGELNDSSYLYLGSYNVNYNLFTWLNETRFQSIKLPLPSTKNIIYSNGNSEIVI